MSNVNRLAELRNEASALHVQMKSHRDLLKTGEDGLPEFEPSEWQETWDKMESDYDSKLAEIKKVEGALKAQHSADERLGKIADELNSGLGYTQRDPRKLDSTNLKDNIANWMENQLYAFQGWIFKNDTDDRIRNQLNDTHRQAAQNLGINLNSNGFSFKMAPTPAFMAARNNYLHGKTRGGAYNVLQVGQGSAGGFTVGETLLNRMEQALLDFSGVMQVADVLRTATGEQLIWPMVDDTSNSGIRVGEGVDVGDATNPSFKRLILHSHIYTSRELKVSRTLLRDSIMNLVSIIGDMLGTRIGRKLNTDFTVGSGGGDAPRGIVTASALGVTAASTSAIAFDEVIDLEHAIDPARRSGAAYMFHDSILQILRKLKDGEGRYLWSNGTQEGGPDMINGRPYFINQDMASTVASTNKTMLFGQLNQYKVRQVEDFRMQRIVEKFADTNEDAFIGYLDADGGLLNAGDDPVQHLVH